MITEVADKKKLAAAIAGVAAYLQSEQEAAAVMGLPTAEVPVEPPRLWGISGRQTQMMDRRLMQMRTFK